MAVFVLFGDVFGVDANGLSWGAYVGENISDIAEFETATGRSPDIIAVFVHWGSNRDFPMQYKDAVAGRNKTLLVFWEPLGFNGLRTEDPGFSYDSILRGDWDGYFVNFTLDAQAYGGPVILVPFPEMNLAETSWGGTVNNNSAQKHILAYQRIRKVSPKVANVKYGWTVNNIAWPDVPGNRIEDYYPGEGSVDYVGVDGFNFGDDSKSFEDAFGPALARLEKYSKPVYIFSTACYDGSAKSEWIENGLGKLAQNYPFVHGWAWFNADKEHDWRVDSDPESLEAFRRITV